jgi:hypothetical protein
MPDGVEVLSRQQGRRGLTRFLIREEQRDGMTDWAEIAEGDLRIARLDSRPKHPSHPFSQLDRVESLESNAFIAEESTEWGR